MIVEAMLLPSLLSASTQAQGCNFLSGSGEELSFQYLFISLRPYIINPRPISKGANVHK